MKALVTGCAGFIGSHLTESLLRDGHHVIGVDSFNSNYDQSMKLANLGSVRYLQAFDFHPIDITHHAVTELVSECDVVFHLAAEPGVHASWGKRFDAYLRNNVLSTQILLEALSPWPAKRFVYASSSSIYGNAQSIPTPETETPHPLSPYGATKLSGEHLCQLYRANHGLECVILRYFTVYGPRQRPDMALNVFCRAAVSNQPIEVFGDGSQTRDFTFVTDAVAATRSAASAANVGGNAFNIGGGSQISLRDALATLERNLGRSLNITYRETRSGDVADTSADTSLASQFLGYKPSVGFEEGLRAELEWIQGTR